MSELTMFGIILAAIAPIVIFADYLIDAWYDAVDRAKYRRASNPRNIEKNAQDLLELELQQFLLEEETKEKTRNRMDHPTNYSKNTGGGLDGETREILAKLTNPRERQERIFPQQNSSDKNTNYWGSE
jgi:hypothetical protein